MHGPARYDAHLRATEENVTSVIEPELVVVVVVICWCSRKVSGKWTLAKAN